MLSTKYISNCTDKNIDELKTAILFFDKVEIINNVLLQVNSDVKNKQRLESGDMVIITGVTNFVTDNYLKHIELLTKEKHVEIISEDNKREDELWDNVESQVHSILSKNRNILFEEIEIDIIKDKSGRQINSIIAFSDEVKKVHEEFIGPIKRNHIVNLDFIYKYYSSLLSSLFLHISKGETCLTGSNALNKFLWHYSKDSKFKELQHSLSQEDINPSLALDAINLAVPNISSFPFDKVLEAKEKAKSELMAFRDELLTFQFNLLENYTSAEIQSKASDIVKHKLNPKLDDLKRKIEMSNLGIPKKLLQEFKDPKSYTPLIGSLLGAIPVHIATLLSLGIISITTAYDYVLKRKEIKSNGLYYLIQLDKKFR